MTQKTTGSRMTIYQMAGTALMAAVMCILGPLSIPIGPVPISLTNLVVYLAVYLLGTRLGTLSYVVYFLLGAAGLPVFSGYSGGIGKLAGPTGGYLVGFIIMAVISGIFIKNGKSRPVTAICGMVLGTAAAYVIGTIWFMFVTKMGLAESLALCVFPFLIGDGIKIVVSELLGRKLRSRLNLANIVKGA